MRWLFWVLLARSAAAEPVIVVRPLVDGEGMVALGAEVALALDRALPQSPFFTRIGSGMPSALELATALGCEEPDEACLREATEVAGAAFALVARLTRAGAIIGASLERLPADPLRRAVRMTRRIDLGQTPLDDLLLARLGRILAEDLLADQVRRPSALVAPGPPQRIEIDGRPHVLVELLELPAGRYEVGTPGSPPRVTDLLPGELVVLQPSTGVAPTSAPSGRRIGAWMTLGLGGAALVGAGFMGAQLAGTQNDYDRARTGADLREFAARGQGEALAANVLLGVGSAALLVAGLLFWD